MVQEFLYDKNEPPVGSFHDHMLQQKAAAETELLVFFYFSFIFQVFISNIKYFKYF